MRTHMNKLHKRIMAVACIVGLLSNTALVIATEATAGAKQGAISYQELGDKL